MASSLHEFPVALVWDYGAWFVGGAAAPNVDLTKVRDFDIVVPLSQWGGASRLIKAYVDGCEAIIDLNHFGGLKFRLDGILFDVWPCELYELLLNGKMKYLWNPRTNVRYIKETT